MSDQNATAAFYDTVSVSYSEMVSGTAAEAPLDLGYVDQFVALLPTSSAPVLDAGCGAGRMLTYLADHNIGSLAGLDISPRMVELARESHPQIPISVGDIASLPYAADTVRGILCWYAIIHSTANELEAIVADFARVLNEGGVALFGFQVGEGNRMIERAYGHDVTLGAVLHTTAAVTAALEACGLHVIAVGDRAPVGTERNAQGFVIARKTALRE